MIPKRGIKDIDEITTEIKDVSTIKLSLEIIGLQKSGIDPRKFI